MKRSAPIHKGVKKDRAKKAKLDIASTPTSGIFSNVDDVRTALLSNEVEVLTRGNQFEDRLDEPTYDGSNDLALTTLRNQITIRFDEESLLPQDERLLLAKSWLEKSPGAQDMFSIIGRAPRVRTVSYMYRFTLRYQSLCSKQPSSKVSSLCLAVLAALLNLLSTHFVYHALGETVVKTLLSPSHFRQLNNNLSDTSSDLILSTLKLFNAMSNFAGGIEKRAVIDGFAWGQKVLTTAFMPELCFKSHLSFSHFINCFSSAEKAKAAERPRH